MEEHKRINIKKEILEWTYTILIALVIAFLIRNFLFTTSIVSGTSMYPTLEDGERIMLNKVVYFLDEPDRGDVIVLEKGNYKYVKRVIGLPGESIKINNEGLFINGEYIEQDYINEDAIKYTGYLEEFDIPVGYYFVMGDNRKVSKDSRNGLGIVSREEILGRTDLIFYPLKEIEFIK